MSANTLRVAVISFAHLHSEAYIANLRANADVTFVGVLELNPALRRHAPAAPNGNPAAPNGNRVPIFTTYDELFSENIDAAIVCSENIRHPEDIDLLASRGIHLLCEKPLAVRAAAAANMVECCRRAGVILMTAFPMRFSAPLQTARRQLQAGNYGKLSSAIGVNQGQLPKRHRSWFVDPELAGGGAIIDHTAHLADIMRWYTGAEVETVYAIANHILHDEPVETGGLVSLHFSNGVDLSIDCSWSRPDNYPTWGGLSLRLITDRGAVDIDAFIQNNEIFGLPDQHTRWDYWGADANQSMINEFVSAVRKARKPAVSGIDGLRAVEICDAAYRSIETGDIAQVEHHPRP